MWLVNLVILVLGIAILVKAGDFFVKSSIRVAKRFKVSSFIIGLTVVAIGTSIPELGVMIYSMFSNVALIGVGNILGSSIADLTLLLGGAALCAPILLRKQWFWKDVVFLFYAVLLFVVFLLDRELWWFEGLILVILFSVYIFEKVKGEKHLYIGHAVPKKEKNNLQKSVLIKEFFVMILSLGVVLLSARIVVSNGVLLSSELNIAQTVVGGIFIALGTVLPELSVTIASLRRKDQGLLVGNLFGSTITNLLLIGGIGALVGEVVVGSAVMLIMVPVLVIIVGLLLFLTYKEWNLEKTEGVLLLVMYALFVGSLFLL